MVTIFFQDLLAACLSVVCSLPIGVFAFSFGFAAFPTTVAFLVGAIGCIAYNSFTTISFQLESIIWAYQKGNNIKERLTIIFWGGVFLLIPSLFGINELFFSFVGYPIIYSMIAGVGIMLTFFSFKTARFEKTSGNVSIISALVVWFFTKNLFTTVIVSFICSTVAFNILLHKHPSAHVFFKESVDREKFTLHNIQFNIFKNWRLFFAAHGLACLNACGNLCFGKITGTIANAESQMDYIGVYSSIANMLSSFFGGAPVEAFVSPTAAAPNPVRSSVLMMLFMAAILFSRIVPHIGKYIPRTAIAGFAFVLGTFVIFINSIHLAIISSPVPEYAFGSSPWAMIVAATALISARWNPFFGLATGLVLRFALGL